MAVRGPALRRHPALKDARFGADADLFGGADLGSYLAVYWILEDRHDDHVEWALRQVQWLHANGRMFAERDHIHTLLYRHELDRSGAATARCPRSWRSTTPSAA